MTPLDAILLAPIAILAIASLVLLMVGAFTNNAKLTSILTFAFIASAAITLVKLPATGPVFPVPGGDLLEISPFTALASLLLMGLSLLCLPLFSGHFKGSNHKPELYVLLTLSLTGMLLLASSAHLLTLYVSLELMSFPLYILAAFSRTDARSSEAGLKYFVLGGIASALMLFGISLLYASLGTLGFSGLYTAINAATTGGVLPPLLLTGVALTLLGTLFKLSVVPLHMWTPDVYEGSPTAVTAIMGALPKLAAFVLLIRLLHGPFESLHTLWQPGLAILAVASMVVGSTLALAQSNLKRLLAYSTIANIGFILVGVVAATPQANGGVLFYLTIYALTNLGMFGILIATNTKTVEDLKALAAANPILAATFMLFLFSLAGIPPLGGFMAKFTVFAAAVQAGFGMLAVLGVLASVIACFYSLWLIKLIYFDASPATPTTHQPIPMALQLLILVTAMLTVLFGIFPTLLSNLTLAAATAIF